MASARTIIKNAYRKAGITALGAALTAAQANVGLELLEETLADLVHKGTLGRVTDVYTTADYEAKEFERVAASVDTLAVTFPATVLDDLTRETRAPLDGAYITVVGPGRPEDTRVYSALQAAWEPIAGYTLTSSAALSGAYQSDLEALLAAKLADERGIPLGPILTVEVRTARYHLARRDNRPAKGEYM